MNGGIISGNTSNYGGGVYIDNNGNFFMYGGIISGNSAGSGGGGGVLNNGNIKKLLHVGDVQESGNTADRFGGGVFVYSSGTFTMYGGIISGNTAKEFGGGISTFSVFIKYPQSNGQNSGIIFGFDADGFDTDGIPLKNISTWSNNKGPHAVSWTSSGVYRNRNTTVWETDQIDTTTGKGLSANGNPPFGQ